MNIYLFFKGIMNFGYNLKFVRLEKKLLKKKFVGKKLLFEKRENDKLKLKFS